MTIHNEIIAYFRTKINPLKKSIGLIHRIILIMFEGDSINSAIQFYSFGNENLYNKIIHEYCMIQDVYALDTDFFRFLDHPVSLEFPRAMSDVSIAILKALIYMNEGSDSFWLKHLFRIIKREVIDKYDNRIDFQIQIDDLIRSYFFKYNKKKYLTNPMLGIDPMYFKNIKPVMAKLK